MKKYIKVILLAVLGVLFFLFALHVYKINQVTAYKDDTGPYRNDPSKNIKGVRVD